MKILNFGSCNLDYVYTMDHIVSPGETESTDSSDTFPGGKGLNQSIAAARAGAEVYHAGCIGYDGGMLKDILVESGVDVSYLKTVDSKNGHAIIQVSKAGENSIFLYPGSNVMITDEQIDLVLSQFSPGDFLLLQNETNQVASIVEKGYEKGLKIVLNPSPFNEKISQIDFSRLTYLILNEVEAKDISGIDEPEAALARIRKRYPHLSVVLTLGTKGCIYQDSDQTLFHPAFRVQAVDTTAAGDTFTGYFLACLAKGGTVAEGVRIASAASAIAVSRMGAAPSIPYQREVAEALETLIPYGAGKTDSDRSRKEQVLTYLSTHLKDASLPELADLLGYSTVYTGVLVKKVTGLPFSKLLQQTRCCAAAKLLAETDLSVEEIIYSVGYKNETFFRKAFRERYGAAPREYRNQKRGE